jgi:hypothetical protein
MDPTLVLNAQIPEDREQFALTPAEELELCRFESVIAAKLAAFFHVGFALMEIKSRKLYRAEFRTFEEYCRRRWEFNRAHAYRLIGAAEICKSLSPIGDIPLPENECQIRPLVGLPPNVVAKAWKRACKAAGVDGKVTGALVLKAVGDVTGRVQREDKELQRANWQIRVGSLLAEALQATKRGDQEMVAEIVERVSLLLLIGRRRGPDDHSS